MRLIPILLFCQNIFEFYFGHNSDSQAFLFLLHVNVSLKNQTWRFAMKINLSVTTHYPLSKL